MKKNEITRILLPIKTKKQWNNKWNIIRRDTALAESLRKMGHSIVWSCARRLSPSPSLLDAHFRGTYEQQLSGASTTTTTTTDCTDKPPCRERRPRKGVLIKSSSTHQCIVTWNDELISLTKLQLKERDNSQIFHLLAAIRDIWVPHTSLDYCKSLSDSISCQSV